MLVRVDVNHPSLLINLNDPANYDISYVWSVPLSERPNTNDLVYLMHHSSHACVDLVVFLVFVSAVASYEALADMVSWQDNSQLLLSSFLL